MHTVLVTGPTPSGTYVVSISGGSLAVTPSAGGSAADAVGLLQVLM